MVGCNRAWNLSACCGSFCAGPVSDKLLWAWTIPDLFPGDVEQGLVAGSISWLNALKVAIFVAVLAGIAGILASGCEKG